MVSRHWRRFAMGCAVSIGVVVVPATSHAGDDPAPAAPLFGGFQGEMVCDNGFETEGEVGADRPNLSGPCWFDAGQGIVTGRPRFVTEVHEDGARSLELCGYSGCIEAIGQPISVPYGMTSATLSADIMHDGADTSADDCPEPDVSDYAYVQVDGPNDVVADTNYVLHCETGAAGWQHLEADLTAALTNNEGKDANVLVVAVTSSGDVGSRFWVDNVSLDVVAAGKPMTTYERTVTLGLRRHLKATGVVASNDSNAWPECWSGVTVRLDRKKDGEWVRMPQKATTDDGGAFAVTLPDRQGKYRAVVARTQLDVANRCARALSPAGEHTH